MKYIRIKDEIRPVCKADEPLFDKRKMVEKLEKLFDMFIVVCRDGNIDLYRYADYTTRYLAQNEIYIQEIYGAIYVKGKKNEPILKSVAKLNIEGAFELL